MNFTAAVQEVLGMVKRPDKILGIQRQINSAVRFYCIDSDFKRDLEEIVYAIVPTEYSNNIPYTAFPRFRKFKYIKRPGSKCFMNEIGTSKITKGEIGADQYYLAGSGIRYNLEALSANLNVGWYAYPPVLTNADPDFWLLESQPYMIIDRAASFLFADIGDEQSATRHKNQANEAYLSFRGDQLDT